MKCSLIALASRRSKISMISPVSASTYSNAICPFLYLNSSNDRCLGKDWYCLWCFFASVVMTRCTVEVDTKQSLAISVKDCASVDFTRIFAFVRSEEHTSELQSRGHLVCRLLLEKKN